MLPTFVIGLREGLEAALIVSIIATFLRRNGAGLRAMWVGVGTAIGLAVAVGVGLRLLERGLPQRQQEGLETVIGALAVVLVTAMILWMRTHARTLKRDLESAAESALGDGTSRALAVMAFVAVLREGFETSVFLLGTFASASTASGSSVAPVVGAVLGLALAVAIGIGIYAGGVRLNLARFFKVTGVFLVFVAAGLVLSALRTAHEAGWVQVGQGRTVDLGWLAPTGAVRTALISGVLGVPADPRLIELVGWLLYLVPVLAITLWPQRLRPTAARALVLRRVGAGVLVAGAAALALAVPAVHAELPGAAPLDGGGTATVARTDAEHATLTLAGGERTTPTVLDLTAPRANDGNADTLWTAAGAATGLPTRLTLTELLTYTGQRVPVGLDVARAPGPYDAVWTARGSAMVGTRSTGSGAGDVGLVTGSADTSLVLRLSGGGLTSPRVIALDDSDDAAGSWRLDPTYTVAAARAVGAAQVAEGDRRFLQEWLPVVLLVAAAVLLLGTVRRPALRRRRPAPAGAALTH